MYRKISEDLLSFIANCPTAFHTVQVIKNILNEQGFKELSEGDAWLLEPGRAYYVTRNQSSLIAFKTGEDLRRYSFNITAAHTDSPTFKLKENCEIELAGKYLQLNTEGYGGMICSSWFDRPLSIAGRVMMKGRNRIVSKLVNIERDLALIPNVAIHFNRDINNGYSYNKQVDLLPLLGGAAAKKGDVLKLVAKELGISPTVIYGMDLYLYNRQAPAIWGMNEEFISSPRLDDLQCVYSALGGFLQAEQKSSINVMACFDNEEVGSATKQGAGSTFLEETLKRINHNLGFDEENYYRALAGSFMLSIDNAHAVHPNHPEKTDRENCVYMNEGVVVKSHAGTRYTSDALGVALIKSLAKHCNVPLQYFSNRSDVVGGSTLGHIAMSHVSINCVDLGLAQLAMHSAYETAGVKDTLWMIDLLKEFYSRHLEVVDAATLVFK